MAQEWQVTSLGVIASCKHYPSHSEAYPLPTSVLLYQCGTSPSLSLSLSNPSRCHFWLSSILSLSRSHSLSLSLSLFSPPYTFSFRGAHIHSFTRLCPPPFTPPCFLPRLGARDHRRAAISSPSFEQRGSNACFIHEIRHNHTLQKKQETIEGNLVIFKGVI